MRHQGATVHELARIAELAGVPGQTLTRLAEHMARQELRPGERLEGTGLFGVVLAGMVSGPSGLLRPGQTFGGPVSAAVPATVATCDRAVYEELLRGR